MKVRMPAEADNGVIKVVVKARMVATVLSFFNFVLL